MPSCLAISKPLILPENMAEDASAISCDRLQQTQGNPLPVPVEGTRQLGLNQRQLTHNHRGFLVQCLVMGWNPDHLPWK
jgi:hypothetical protein